MLEITYKYRIKVPHDYDATKGSSKSWWDEFRTREDAEAKSLVWQSSARSEYFKQTVSVIYVKAYVKFESAWEILDKQDL